MANKDDLRRSITRLEKQIRAARFVLSGFASELLLNRILLADRAVKRRQRRISDRVKE